MSKCSRPLTLILTIILSFSIFSVNAFAAEDENLIDSDLRNWQDMSDLDSEYGDVAAVLSPTYSDSYFVSLGTHAKCAFLYQLTDIKVDTSYTFSFLLIDNQTAATFFDNYTLTVGAGSLINGEFEPFDEPVFYTISSDNYKSFCSDNFKLSFKLNNFFGTPYLAFMMVPKVTSVSFQTGFYIKDVSFVENNTASLEKLDGILGWLQELWDSITEGFSNLGLSITHLGDRLQTKLGEVITNLSGELQSVKEGITTKLGDVITNLSGVLNSVKEGITTKLGEVITGLTGELRYLGDRIINYLLYFSSEVPENPFKTEESPLSKVQGYIDDVVNYINDFTEDMDDVIDSLSAGITIFRDFVEENKWIMILVAVSLFLIVVGRFVGI